MQMPQSHWLSYCRLSAIRQHLIEDRFQNGDVWALFAKFRGKIVESILVFYSPTNDLFIMIFAKTMRLFALDFYEVIVDELISSS